MLRLALQKGDVHPGMFLGSLQLSDCTLGNRCFGTAQAQVYYKPGKNARIGFAPI
jgi:hypothetical protein